MKITLPRGVAALALLCLFVPRASALTYTFTATASANGTGGAPNLSAGVTWEAPIAPSNIGVPNAVEVYYHVTSQVGAYTYNPFSYPIVESTSMWIESHLTFYVPPDKLFFMLPGGTLFSSSITPYVTLQPGETTGRHTTFEQEYTVRFTGADVANFLGPTPPRLILQAVASANGHYGGAGHTATYFASVTYFVPDGSSTLWLGAMAFGVLLHLRSIFRRPTEYVGVDSTK
jgi:hypothetical protein